MINPTDLQFGKMATSKGFINSGVLSQCLQLQQEIIKQGHSTSLAQIMLQKGHLSQFQVQEILRLTIAATVDNKVDGKTEETKIKRLGRYEILEMLGQGGMGSVYKVKDSQLDRFLALKVLISEENEKNTLRFLREAKAIARLTHPNIVALHDVGREEGKNFFTMEFVQGHTLQQLLKEKDFTSHEVAQTISKVAQAIHYAHSKGIIHRDLKPGNIMLDQAGVPKVMDFGLAKVSNASHQLSQTGVVVGTLFYMPPEQAQGRSKFIDARSDVYSLGAVMYELLTKNAPFTGDTFSQVLQQILEQNPLEPSKINPEIPATIEAICLKALAKKKNGRYQSAKDLASDLENFLNDKPLIAATPTRSRKFYHWIIKNRANTIAVIATTILLTTMIFIYFWQINKEHKLKIKLKNLAKQTQKEQWKLDLLLASKPEEIKKAIDNVSKLKKKSIPVFAICIEDYKKRTIVLRKIAKIKSLAFPIFRQAFEISLARYTASRMIIRCGPEAIDVLLDLLNHKEKLVRRVVLDALLQAQIKPTKNIIEKITKKLGDPDKEVQLKATKVLWHLGVQDKSIVAKIISLSEVKFLSWAQKSVLEALAKTKDPKAIDIVKKAAKTHKTTDVRAKAIVELWKIDRNHTKAIGYFKELLKNKSSFARSDAMNGLREMGKDAAPILPVLLDLLDKAKLSYEQIALAKILGEIGPQAAKAVAKLTPLLNPKNLLVSKYTIQALGKIGPKSATAIPAINKLKKRKGKYSVGTLSVIFIDDFVNKTFSKKLRREFNKKKIPLSQKVTIEQGEDENKWRIKGKINQYLVEDSGTSLGVYETLQQVIQKATASIQK